MIKGLKGGVALSFSCIPGGEPCFIFRWYRGTAQGFRRHHQPQQTSAFFNDEHRESGSHQMISEASQVHENEISNLAGREMAPPDRDRPLTAHSKGEESAGRRHRLRLILTLERVLRDSRRALRARL